MLFFSFQHLLIMVLLFSYFQISDEHSPYSWILSTEEEGIKVYSKTVSDSKIKAIKVECELNAGTTQVAALLLDAPAAEQWVCHTKSCVLLKKISASELYYYTEVSLPWPLDNRDFVTHMKVSQDPLTKVVTVHAPAVPGWVINKKGNVRINHSKSLWIITPLANEKVKLEYSLQVDPGGSIPVWVINKFAVQGPIESIKNMKKLLSLTKYKYTTLVY